MTDPANSRVFDPKLTSGMVSLDTLLEFRNTIEGLLAAMERNLHKALGAQETEFQRTFNDQMKLVQDAFQELRAKVDKSVSKEHTDQKYAKVNAEKNFFMGHAMYLHEQNKKLAEKIRVLREELLSVSSEREFYRTQVCRLRDGREETGCAFPGVDKGRLEPRDVPKDIGRLIFGKTSVGITKENRQAGVKERPVHSMNATCKVETTGVGRWLGDKEAAKETSANRVYPKHLFGPISKAERDRLVGSKRVVSIQSAVLKPRRASLHASAARGGPVRPHERIKISNILQSRQEDSLPSVINDALINPLTLSVLAEKQKRNVGSDISD